MRVLLDTNILIHREDSRPVSPNLRILFSTFNDHGTRVLVHPKSIEDINRDLDEDRKRAILSKLQTYSFLEYFPKPAEDPEFSKTVRGPISPNDEVDNSMLYAVHCGLVDYLITEDKELHSKSERVGCRDRVLSVDEMLALLRRTSLRRRPILPPALSTTTVKGLDLKDPFFNSLKADYSEFESWFAKCAVELRPCWAYFRNDSSIGALLIHKIETGPIDSTPPRPPRKRLKISTFKVEHTGYKIGELFIKLAVQYAIGTDCKEIYLTHFVRGEDDLVELIEEYGFENVGENSRKESIFLKDIVPNRADLIKLPPVTVSQKHYPAFADGVSIKKFLVPIRPRFHEKLFVDYALRQTTLPEYRGEFTVPGNTIKKAYLCNSNNRSISKGDIMLFYRSDDRREITSIGVVESVFRKMRSIERVPQLVEKRTVYSIGEIETMLSRPTMVLLFTWHFHLHHPINLKQLNNMGISVPQTITRISHARYCEIRSRGEMDERFTIH